MGQKLAMPVSRPMPQIGTACHELKLRDEGHAWRIVLCIDTGAIVILDVFAKTTRTTPKAVIDSVPGSARAVSQRMMGFVG